MSLDADSIVDRRRMRRKLTFWRVFAVLFAICAVVAVGAALRVPGTGMLTGRPGASIARVTLTGLIRTDQERVEALERLGSSRARAVIVHINSPGGTTSGSEELFSALSRLKEKKPMVVVVDGLAASGGYITAIAADHIVAQETSLVGSIGVLFQYPERDRAAEDDRRQGRGDQVDAAEGGAQRLRADLAGGARGDRGDRADSYGWFRDLVKTRRQMDDATLERVADGRVFTGRQAVAAQAHRRARRRAHRDRLACQGKEHRPQDAGPRLQAARRG